MALTKATNSMISGAMINVLDYGATGDGVTDDASAIQAAVTAAANAGAGVYFPAGTYIVSTGITVPVVAGSYFSENGLNIIGESRTTAIIKTTADIAVFTIQDFTNFSHLTIQQDGTAGTGKAIYSASQIRFCVFEDLNIIKFKYGHLIRFSLWCSWRDVYYVECTCGVRLARNNSMEDQTDPAAIAAWNAATGWFHNQLTFDNILCNGGEVGIWASCMGTTFNNVTCQNQETTGASNAVLPTGQVGTGVWIEGGGAGSTDSYNNVLLNYYTEDTFISLMIKNAQATSVIGWFAQGESSPGATGSTLLNIDDGKIYVQGQTGTSFWQNAIVANAATVVFDAPYQASGGAVSLTNSTYTGYGNNTLASQSFDFNISDGSGNLAAYTTRGGSYSKNGNVVTVTAWMTGIDTTGMSSADAIRMSLPVTSVTNSGVQFVGSARIDSITLPASYAGVVPTVGSNSPQALLYVNKTAAASSSIIVSNLTSGSAAVYLTISYEV